MKSNLWTNIKEILGVIVIVFTIFYMTNGIDNRLNSVEERLNSMDSAIGSVKQEVGELKGRMDSIQLFFTNSLKSQ